MISQADIYRLAAACDRFGVEPPKGAAEATKVHQAAVKQASDITHAPAPNLDGITVANLAKRLDDLVNWEHREERMNAANRVADHAASEACHLWWAASPELIDKFAPVFAATVKRFTDNLAALDGVTSAEYAVSTNRSKEHNDLRAAADDLCELGVVWGLIKPAYDPLGNSARQGLPQFIKASGLQALSRAWGHWQRAGFGGIDGIRDLMAIEGIALEWPKANDAPQDQAGVIAAGQKAARNA